MITPDSAQGPYAASGIKPGPAAHKVSTLTTVPSFGADQSILHSSFNFTLSRINRATHSFHPVILVWLFLAAESQAVGLSGSPQHSGSTWDPSRLHTCPGPVYGTEPSAGPLPLEAQEQRTMVASGVQGSTRVETCSLRLGRRYLCHWANVQIP